MEKRSSTVFVANLPFNTTEDQLKEIFEDIGPLKTIRIVTDRDTGRQRGFSFLEFHDVTTAEAAVRNLNEHDLNGRKLKVHFAANDMDSKSRSQGKGGLLSIACMLSCVNVSYGDLQPSRLCKRCQTRSAWGHEAELLERAAGGARSGW